MRKYLDYEGLQSLVGNIKNCYLLELGMSGGAGGLMVDSTADQAEINAIVNGSAPMPAAIKINYQDDGKSYVINTCQVRGGTFWMYIPSGVSLTDGDGITHTNTWMRLNYDMFVDAADYYASTAAVNNVHADLSVNSARLMREDFDQGMIATAQDYKTSNATTVSTTAIRSRYALRAGRNCKITCKTGFEAMYVMYSARKKNAGASAWASSASIAKGTVFRVMVRRTDGASISTDVINKYCFITGIDEQPWLSTDIN